MLYLSSTFLFHLKVHPLVQWLSGSRVYDPMLVGSVWWDCWVDVILDSSCRPVANLQK